MYMYICVLCGSCYSVSRVKVSIQKVVTSCFTLARVKVSLSPTLALGGKDYNEVPGLGCFFFISDGVAL